MPFDVEMPDGTIISDIPDGTTKEQVLAKYNAMQGVVAQQPTQPTKRSTLEEIGRQVGLTARAGYEAFTSPATAVLEAGRTAYNLGAQALGSQSRLPSFYAEQAKSLTSAGLPQAETGLERAVQAGTQAMASTGAAAKMLPNVPALAGDLIRQVPSAGVGGLLSQPAAEAVKDITGSDLAALIAGGVVGAAGAAGTGKGITAAQQAKTPLYTMEQIKQRASRSYNAMDEAGVVMKPTSTQGMINDIKTALDDARMIPGTDQAKTVNASLDQITKMINQQGVSFTALEKMREILNDLKGNPDKSIRRLGNVAVNQFDNYVSNVTGKDVLAGQAGLDKAVQSVMSARKDWRNMSRASVLDDALNVAEAKALDPKASESELIRRGFINIAADKNKMSLFSKNEQNAIKAVAKGGTLDPLLSIAARFSPLRSQLTAATEMAAFTQMPTTAAAVAGGGLAADLLQGALRQRAADLAIKQIASGAVPTPQQSLAYRGLLSTALNPPTGE
jgi:hypothetical protein